MLDPEVVTTRPAPATTGLPKDGWRSGTDQAMVGWAPPSRSADTVPSMVTT